MSDESSFSSANSAVLLFQDLVSDPGWKVFEKLNSGSCARISGTGSFGNTGFGSSSGNPAGFGGSSFSPDGGGTIGGESF